MKYVISVEVDLIDADPSALLDCAIEWGERMACEFNGKFNEETARVTVEVRTNE